MGVKSYSGDRLLYFDFYFSYALFATALGPTTALLRWLKASVSGQVKSEVKSFLSYLALLVYSRIS